MEAETTLALAEHPNIVAVKEASGNLAQMSEIVRHRPAHFSVISGDDPLTLGLIAAGGYPDDVRKGDAISGLDAAATLPGKVFHAGTEKRGDFKENAGA